MAVSITSTYAGEAAMGYLSPALLSGKSLADGAFTIKPNVKYKEVLRIANSSSDMIGNATCDFTDDGDIVLTERILEPKELQLNTEICKTPFQSDWDALSMGAGVANQSLPKNFNDFLIAHFAGIVAEATELSVWNGDSNTAGEFDGIITKLNADATFTGTSRNISGGTVTAANVIDELGKVVDAIPTNVYGKEDLKIFVASNVARAYVRALGGFGASGLGANGSNNEGTQWYTNGSLSFDGIEIFVAPGLTANQMVAARTSNLFFATGLMSDQNEVKVIDMADIDGSKNVRVIMRYTGIANYGLASEVVLYA